MVFKDSSVVGYNSFQIHFRYLLIYFRDSRLAGAVTNQSKSPRVCIKPVSQLADTILPEIHHLPHCKSFKKKIPNLSKIQTFCMLSLV